MNTKLKSVYQHLLCCSLAQSFPYILEAGGMRLLIFTITLFFSLQSCEEKDELEVITPQVPAVENPENAFEVEGSTNIGGTMKQGYLYGAPITYQEIEGQAIYQGDIILTPAQLAQGESVKNGRTSGAGNAAADHFWPNNRVYYNIDTRFSSQDKAKIEEAVYVWNAFTNLTFEKSATQSNRIKFVPSNKNASPVGMTGGEQKIELASTFKIGTAIHEIGHSLGLFHEHSRNDRDSHVTIYWDNINSDAKHNFEKYAELENEDGIPYFMGFDHGTFDFGSIMMYPMDAFAIDKSKPTITRRDGSSYTAQRDLPSQNDLAVVNDMYPRSFISVTALPAQDVSVGADGTVYMISRAYYNNNSSNPYGYSIYRWLGGSLGWTKEQNMGAIAMDVAPDGTPWVVTKTYQIFRKVNNSWEQVPGSARDIGIGANGTVWIISNTPVTGGYKVSRKITTGWTSINGSGGVAIDVNADGNPWVITSDKQIYRQIPGHRSLSKVTGWGYEITSDSQNGIYMLSGIGTNHALYKWTGSRWLKQPGNGVKVSAGQANNLWVVKADGTLYRRD